MTIAPSDNCPKKMKWGEILHMSTYTAMSFVAIMHHSKQATRLQDASFLEVMLS